MKFKNSEYLVFFSMLCMSVMLCNAIFTNRYISLSNHLFVLGGTFTSPLFFILTDIIAEIFGYKITKYLIGSGFICLTLFALISKLIIWAPYPAFFKDSYHYSFIFNKLLYIDMSSFIAFFASGIINIRMITKWKALVQGRYFWLRSLGSSTIAEAFYSLIAILMMQINLIPLHDILKLTLASYTIKVIYSILFAIPGNMLVNYIKKRTCVDTEEMPYSFNPFKQVNTS